MQTRLTVVFVALFLLFNGARVSISAQECTSPISSDDKAKPIRVEDTAKFFEDFLTRAKRGQFETTEEYKKRLSSFDGTSIVYFRVRGESGILGQEERATFEYDADNQKLTAVGGTLLLPNWLSRKQRSLISLREETSRNDDISELDPFVTYTHTWYCLDISNWSKCSSDLVDKKKRHFRIALTKSPAEAQALITNMEIVIAVRLLGYEQTATYSKYFPATLDNLWGDAQYAKVIKATLAKVVLREWTSSQVLVERAVDF